MKLLLIAISLMLSLTVVQAVPQFSAALDILSGADRALAERSSGVAEDGRRVLNLNRRLRDLRLACRAAHAQPELIPLITAAAQASAAVQESILRKRVAAELLRRDRYNFWLSPTVRDPLGDCAIPGDLRWPRAEIATVHGERAGTRIFLEGDNIYWSYAHDAVRVL